MVNKYVLCKSTKWKSSTIAPTPPALTKICHTTEPHYKTKDFEEYHKYLKR